MIEVTQKNRHGTVEILAQYETEEEFGKAHWPADVEKEFSTKPNMVGVEQVWYAEAGCYVHHPIFMKVAYNEKGKILDVGHLVGLARKYNERYNRWYSYRPWNPWSKKRWRKGGCYRQMKTTQERRWANAWDDEEFAPKVRGRRNAKNLPNAWDDWWRRDMENNNWKRYRKHQWKEK